MTHPTEQELLAFGLGKLSVTDLERIAKHVSDCEHCCRFFDNMPDDTIMELAREAKSAEFSIGTDEFTFGSTATTRKTSIRPDELPSELMNHSRYELMGLLGAGGMGLVFRAKHRLMERMVALKIIHPEYVANRVAVERFRREVKAAAQLAHANIVSAYDAEQAGALHFLVMEFVEGESLDKVLRRRKRIPVKECIDMIRQVALGLQHAHDKGMVHRDIKPHNLMLTSDGMVKILDFGLAKIVVEHAQPTIPAIQKRITSIDTVVGTPDYLAPEQARSSSAVDARGDLYSLGCTFYHLLTGTPPFPKGNALEKLVQHCNSEPAPLLKVLPTCPTVLEDVVKKMIAKKPQDRFQTAGEVIAALDQVSQNDVKKTKVISDKPDRSIGSPGTLQAENSSAPKRSISYGWLFMGIGGFSLLLLSIPVILIIIAFNNDQNPSLDPPIDTPAKKTVRVLFVVSHRGLWYPDFGPVRDVLQKNGIEVVVASSELGPVQLHPQDKSIVPPVIPDKALDGTLSAEGFDAILFCGANSEDLVGASTAAKNVQQLLDDVARNPAKLMGAICIGQKVLGAHGFLKGKRVSWSPELTKQEGLTPEVYGIAKTAVSNVTLDGNLLTSPLPDTAEEFGQAIVSYFSQSAAQSK